jgi:hypothetical protein
MFSIFKLNNNNLVDLKMEAPAGFEPAIKLLQSHALPLGYGASTINFTIKSIFLKIIFFISFL